MHRSTFEIDELSCVNRLKQLHCRRETCLNRSIFGLDDIHEFSYFNYNLYDFYIDELGKVNRLDVVATNVPLK